MPNIPRTMTEEARTAYRAGWAAADRGTDWDAGANRWTNAHGTEHEDDWMDGYEDRAAIRERWHTPRCRIAGTWGNGSCPEH